MSRACSRARSSGSWTSPEGTSRAVFRSSSVAATTRNSVTSSSPASAPSRRVWAMNSSVTAWSATSVTSRRLESMRPNSRSNGPVKLVRWTVNARGSATSVAAPAGSSPEGGPTPVTARSPAALDDLAREGTVGLRARGLRGPRGDRLAGDGGLREPDGAGDEGVEHLVAEHLDDPAEHVPGVDRPPVEHRDEDAREVQARVDAV